MASESQSFTPRGRSTKTDVARRIQEAISDSRLPLREFAARVGTSASRLSTYANGKVCPSAAMFLDIEAVAQDARQPEPPQEERRWWPTVAEIAGHIRERLEEDDRTGAMRLLADGINCLPDAAAQHRLDDALQAPPSTGNQRWDTMLAAAVRYRLHQLGERPPAWTYKPPLDAFWWPTRLSPSQQYNDMAHTPAEFRRVGIFIDEKELDSA